MSIRRITTARSDELQGHGFAFIDRGGQQPVLFGDMEGRVTLVFGFGIGRNVESLLEVGDFADTVEEAHIAFFEAGNLFDGISEGFVAEGG